MTARIMERANDTVLATDDDDTVAADLMGDVAACLWQLANRGNKKPLPVEDRLQVLLEHFWTGVEGSLQSVARLAPRQHLTDR